MQSVSYFQNEFDLSNMGKRAIKDRLKAKSIVSDWLYTFGVAVSSLHHYLKDLPSHQVHLLNILLVQILWINLKCRKQPQMQKLDGV